MVARVRVDDEWLVHLGVGENSGGSEQFFEGPEAGFDVRCPDEWVFMDREVSKWLADGREVFDNLR